MSPHTTPPILVLMRDRLGCARRLVDVLEERFDPRIIFIDSQSTYGPTIDYLRTTRHQVVRLGANVGQRAVWDAGILDALEITGRYVVTDPDVVPDPACPDDLFEHLGSVLDRYPDVAKVGLGLRIDDLPSRYSHRDTAIAWETPFWSRPVAPGLFDAPVDTTFALYRADVRQYILEPALRTDVPYLAQHLSWYLDDANPPPDERYYRAHAAPAVANWVRTDLPDWLESGSGHPFGALAHISEGTNSP